MTVKRQVPIGSLSDDTKTSEGKVIFNLLLRHMKMRLWVVSGK